MFEAALIPRAVYYGVVKGSGLDSLFAGPHEGSFSRKEPPVPLFSAVDRGQLRAWGRGPRGILGEHCARLFR
jgi:hypothetical protein